MSFAVGAREVRHFALAIGGAVLVGAAVAAQSSQTRAPASTQAARCRVDGRATSGTAPLPGVSILVRTGDVLKAVTSTDIDGRYSIFFAPGASYHIETDLTAFASAERDVTMGAPPCDTTIDFQLSLVPRTAPGSPVAARRSTEAATQARAGRGGGGGRGRGANATAAAAQPRFQALNVEADASGAAALEEQTADVDRLLPTGFSAESQGEAVAVSGNSDAANIDRGALNDRLAAIGRGQLDPATGQFTNAFGGDGAQIPGAEPGGFGRFGGGGGGGGGRGGAGGFFLGGRGARGQSPYQGSATYTFGGSALNTPPYQLRPDVPMTQPQYAQNTFGGTFGGPLKIPGLYADTNRRTNFQVNYTGNRTSNVIDDYATVPTLAERSGDFSASPLRLVDPSTGQPFANNQIPASRVSPAAQALLNFIPAPNLPGDSRNFHLSTLSQTSAESLSLRMTQNLSTDVAPGGGRGGFAGGRGGFGGRGAGARGGQGARGTNVMLNAQLQYRRTDTQSVNVFPGLGGETINTSIAAPVGLTVVRGRSIQNVTVNFTHATVETSNAFSGANDVAGQAGILYPPGSATDPFNWGVPSLLFSGFTSLRGANASTRTDDRLTTSYFWTHPIATHQVRVGGDYRLDVSNNETNANPRGAFTFTGLYATGGSQVAGASGADFADFLLGAPQQAALQVGGTSRLRGHSFDAYVEDTWRKSANLTFNLGLRYELVLPYIEVNGRMANLDAAPNFTAVSPVLSGASGSFTGGFPRGLLNPDFNNLGPRAAFAYRVGPSTILRGGYSITYNPASYAAIARQLVAQPPFAQTETVLGTPSTPLNLSTALVSSTSTTTNNYGVDKNYALGQIQTWNAAVTRNLSPVWSLVVGYTGAKGTNLDVLSAPNRGAAGLLIPGVQAFTWESSDGRSILNAMNVQLMKRLSRGISGNLSYTLAKSMDNAPSIGGGTTVAQNPKDLASEWALSNFDRRQQLTGNLLVELPFGPNRRWLNNGGVWANLFGSWSATINYTAQTGTPLTAHVIGAASDVFRGSNGSLRADLTGAAVQEDDPTIDEFFDPSAFAVPSAGTFGDSPRNVIIGPGGHQLNATLMRDLRIGDNRTITLQVNALNVFNTLQWATVDTNVNSPTFGQVLSVKPMRAVTVTARFRF